jgi:hypothetical protein
MENNETNIQDILNRYTVCMTDIKKRTEVIHKFLKKGLTTGYVLTDTETIALQFRKIFELIALSSLVAHKDKYSEVRTSFATDWNVNGIIKTIEKINPNFYPIATKQNFDEKGKVISTVNITEGFLTQTEYLDAINICSDMLHSENPFSQKKDFVSIYKLFPDWYKKTITLLNHHQVQLYDLNYQIWCIMKGKSPDKKLNGKVQVTLMKLVGRK